MNDDKFTYTYSAPTKRERREIEDIKKQYVTETEQKAKFTKRLQLINNPATTARYNDITKINKGDLIMEQTQELKQIEQIRSGYVDHEETRLEKLKKLDRKVKLPAEITAYTVGIGGSLVLGTGMSLSMKVIGATLNPAIGIVVGVVGIAIVTANYFLYRFILKKRKSKYSEKILSLCDNA